MKAHAILTTIVLTSLCLALRADGPTPTVSNEGDHEIFDGTKHLVPSRLDLSSSDREKAFTPWSTPAEASESWEKMAKENVPIYKQFKADDLSRDLYVPNPGIAYWVLGGMSESTFWKVEAEKEKIGDALISASVCRDPNGVTNIWALWAPRKRAYLLLFKMMELGITQAKIEDSPASPTGAPMPEGAKPLLPDGKYLIVSYDKDDAEIGRCGILNSEDGVFIGFPAPTDHLEFAVKPLRIYVDKDRFQFSVGPANYDARVVNQLAPGTTTYVGQFFQGKFIGVKTTAGWATETHKFVLQKE